MAVLAAVVLTPAAHKDANSCKSRYRHEYPRAHIFEPLAPPFPLQFNVVIVDLPCSRQNQ